MVEQIWTETNSHLGNWCALSCKWSWFKTSQGHNTQEPCCDIIHDCAQR